MKPRISIIVAATENGVIGKHNSLPWKLADDLKSFKNLTLGKPIIMGRKTFESIGRILPGRLNIVISKENDFEGVEMASSLEEAIKIAEKEKTEEIFIIGGAMIYRHALAIADRIYLSRVCIKLDGDAFFPVIKDHEWKQISKVRFDKSEKNEYDFDLFILDKKV